MTMMSDLPHDLVEEILSRVPRTSLRAVRSTCKLWNALSKTRILCNAKADHKFLGFTMMDRMLFTMRFNLHEIGRNDEELVDPSIKPIGNNILDQVEISEVFYCDGLLLCVTRDHSRRLVVWNPYLGQTRWINPRNVLRRRPKYALGYDNNKNHKILRFFDYRQDYYKIYDFKSNSWSLPDFTPNWAICFNEHGVSLNGNTYFMSRERKVMDEYDSILSFDFTTERFGQILPLPVRPSSTNTWALSCVREEILAVLYQYSRGLMEIWVTIRIEPNAASWSKFLRVDMEPPIGLGFVFNVNKDDSFFIDEEKQVVLVFSSDKSNTSMAYIIGDNRHLKIVDLEKVAKSEESVEIGRRVFSYWPLMCSSSYYVPSLVQINQFTGLLEEREEDEAQK